VEIVYIILQQMYSRTVVPNFTTIAKVLYEILQKHFSFIFPDTV